MNMRLLIFTVLLIITVVACKQDVVIKPFKTGMEGKPLPDFTIQLPDSINFIKTSSISREKDLLLFYYSPTCPYCRAQLRDMLNNIEMFKEKQLCILTRADLKSMNMFANYFGLENIQGIIIGRDTGSVIEKHYRLMSVPFTAYFDKNKILKTAYSGRMNPDLLFHIQ